MPKFKKEKLELLAPAKDKETGITAIQCGADAVYIGANKFGARSSAGNTLEDIKELVQFANKYWAKVYVTINTLFSDDEILAARELIHRLYDIGVNAIIVQDMGILELDLPPIPLFASTQCHNNTWQKVDFLEKVGFQRVILARELSLEQIKEIKSKTNIDLEFFVHGSLCVSYSGQCYLSYVNGGRSGNRGECAQPCRKKYTLTDSNRKILAKDKYLLSLKDLNLSDCLDELADAGISSFKIEGRLKDINYIKNIVSYYRHKIDKTTPEFDFNPNKTFNRGYTKYFLTGKNRDITAFDSPKHMGEPMGNIENAKLNNGDGITYYDENGELHGTNWPGKVKNSTIIYRNHDHEYIKKLKSLKSERKIKIKIELNREFLKFTDKNGNAGQYDITEAFEQAQNRNMAVKNLAKQLSKLGDTLFAAEEIIVSTDFVPFIPISILNEMRRKAADALLEERLRNYPRKKFKITPNNYPYPEKTVDYRANILNSQAREFYQRHGVEITEQAAESGTLMTGKKLMTCKHCLKYQFGLCGTKDKTLYLKDEKTTYKLEFDCNKCEMSVYN